MPKIANRQVFAEASRGPLAKRSLQPKADRRAALRSKRRGFFTGVATRVGAPDIRVRGRLPIIRNGTLERDRRKRRAGTEQDEECALAALAAVRKSDLSARRPPSDILRSLLCRTGGER